MRGSSLINRAETPTTIVYVCVCKGITQAELLELTSNRKLETNHCADMMLNHASETLGVGTGCGRCLEFAGGLIENQIDLEGPPTS